MLIKVVPTIFIQLDGGDVGEKAVRRCSSPHFDGL